MQKMSSTYLIYKVEACAGAYPEISKGGAQFKT